MPSEPYGSRERQTGDRLRQTRQTHRERSKSTHFENITRFGITWNHFAKYSRK